MGFWDRLFGRKAPAVAPALPAPPGNTARSVDPREAFFQQVEAVLRADPKVEQVQRLPGSDTLGVTRAGRGVRVFLENVFADTRELPPEARVQVIQRFLGSLWQEGQVLPSWEEVRRYLRPVLRASTYGLEQLAANPGLLGRRTLPFLLELVVVDLPESPTFYFAERRHLQEWGVDEDTVFSEARANLAGLVQTGVGLYDREPSPIWSVDTGDAYEPSRLLHPGFLASFAGRVDGRPIAIIPERSTLLIAGDANPATVARLCESGEREYVASARRLSPALYTVDDAGHVVPYRRPGGDALAQRVRRGHVALAMAEYAAQKVALDKLHEANGVGLYVTNLGGIDREKDARPITWSVWAQGVSALLPRADLVALNPGPDDFFLVPWADVERLAPGGLTPVPDLWPPRHRTTAWPSPDVLEQLRAAQVDLEEYDSP